MHKLRITMNPLDYMEYIRFKNVKRNISRYVNSYYKKKHIALYTLKTP